MELSELHALIVSLTAKVDALTKLCTPAKVETPKVLTEDEKNAAILAKYNELTGFDKAVYFKANAKVIRASVK